MSIKFPLGDAEIIFNWDTGAYTALRNKFFSEKTKIMEVFWNELDNTSCDLDYFNKIYSLSLTILDHLYGQFSEEFIKMGDYSIAPNKWRTNKNFSSIIEPILNVINAAKNEFDTLEEYKQLEAERRAYRKAYRSRIVGGGFGVGGLIKGALTAAAINSVTGAVHSVYNSLDELATNKNIKAAKKNIGEKFDDEIKEAINSSSYRLFYLITLQLKVKTELDFEENRIILENISKNIIKGNFVILALNKALQIYPYNYDTYAMYIERFPKYSDELKAIANHFDVDIQGFIDAAHISDGFYFDDINDSKFVLRNILTKLVELELEFFPDTDELFTWMNEELLLEKANHQFLEAIITIYQETIVPEDKIQIKTYIAEKISYYTKLLEILNTKTIFPYEVVQELSKLNPFRLTKRFRGEKTNLAKFISASEHAKLDLKHAFFVYGAENSIGNISCIILDIDKINIVGIDKALSVKYTDISNFRFSWPFAIIEVRNTNESNDGIIKINMGLEKDSDGGDKDFSQFLKMIYNPESLTEEIQSAILDKHTSDNRVMSLKETIDSLDDINNRTVDGVLYPSVKDAEDALSEVNMIKALTNNNVFSTNHSEIQEWKLKLSSTNFVSQSATKLVEKVNLLASFGRYDLMCLEYVKDLLIKLDGDNIVNEHNMCELQKKFSNDVDAGEILLFYEQYSAFHLKITTRGIRLNVYDKSLGLCGISKFLRYGSLFACMYVTDRIIFIEDDEGLYNRTNCLFTCRSTLNQTQLYDISDLVTLIRLLIDFYMKNHTNNNKVKERLSSKTYYFYNNILEKMIQFSSYANRPHDVFDGSNIDLYYDETRANLPTRNSYIFSFIPCASDYKNNLIALTDVGMCICHKGKTDNYSWDILSEVPIGSKTSIWTGAKYITLGNKEIDMGATKAEPEEFAEYIKRLVAFYKENIEIIESTNVLENVSCASTITLTGTINERIATLRNISNLPHSKDLNFTNNILNNHKHNATSSYLSAYGINADDIWMLYNSNDTGTMGFAAANNYILNDMGQGFALNDISTMMITNDGHLYVTNKSGEAYYLYSNIPVDDNINKFNEILNAIFCPDDGIIHP